MKCVTRQPDLLSYFIQRKRQQEDQRLQPNDNGMMGRHLGKITVIYAQPGRRCVRIGWVVTRRGHIAKTTYSSVCEAENIQRSV